MNFLLDTNVVSEWAKARPNSSVIAWLAEVDEDRVFLSVVTLAELRRGVERLSVGERRRRLEIWLQDDLPMRFESRVLPVDELVANEWGRVVARREAQGHAIHAMDALIAATAGIHSLTLVTRNEADFQPTVKAIVNPWN
jgi:predicted nucleic acid-binding protein